MIKLQDFLVGVLSSHWKNMLVKLDHETPRFGGENKRNI